VRLDLDRLLTLPTAPPAAGPERAFPPAFAGVVVLATVVVFVVATAELLLEVALATPYAPTATAMAATPTATGKVILRENMG
jgi:hypothetical protein